MNATSYTTVDDGDLLYPTLVLTDASGNPLTPNHLTFAIRVGDATTSTDYSATIVKVSDGNYRAVIDTTGMSGVDGQWISGQWIGTAPAQTSEPYQAFVRPRVA